MKRKQLQLNISKCSLILLQKGLQVSLIRFVVEDGDKTIRAVSNHKGLLIYFTFYEKLVHSTEIL